MERIAFVRLSALGDIVHALPAFQALRRSRPQARISWIAEPAGAELLALIPGIDEVVLLDLKTRRGPFARGAALLAFLRRWRGRFDVVLDFQGLIKSALLSFLLGGRRLGFSRGNLREPLAALFYSRRAAPFPEMRHVIFKNLHLLSLLGVAASEVEYPRREWPISPRLAGWLEREGLSGGWTVLNVGGNWSSKRLSAGQWRAVAAGLGAGEYPVLLWGNERERETARDVAGAGVARLAPFLDFADLIGFIARAKLVISGDTLALHLADMTGTPSLGVFGPSSPERNGSLNPASRAVCHRLPCSFCYRRNCDTMACLKSIAAEEILEAARSVDAQRDRNAD